MFGRPRTNLQVGVHSQLLVHQSVRPLVPRSPVHDVTLSFLISQCHRGDLQGKQTLRAGATLAWLSEVQQQFAVPRWFCGMLAGLEERRGGTVWIPVNV